MANTLNIQVKIDDTNLTDTAGTFTLHWVIHCAVFY